MRFFDLFAGIGGFRLGLERAGHTHVGSCEIEKHAREIYKKNFGEHPTHGNIREVDARDVPAHDILTAGFPCQAFSLAGKRLGFADTSGTLFFEIARIAEQKRPRYLFLENVEGLLFHDEGRTFGTILLALDELGYDVEWCVPDGRCWLPQTRERTIIIGHLRGEPTRQVFPIWEEGGQVAGRAEGGATICLPILTPDRLNKRQSGRRFKENGEPAFTVTTIDKHGVFDGKYFRYFTPTECERLQGFPDGWTEGIPEQARYRCLGNAVMPPVVQYIASHL